MTAIVADRETGIVCCIQDAFSRVVLAGVCERTRRRTSLLLPLTAPS